MLKYYNIVGKNIKRMQVCLKEKDELEDNECEADSILLQLQKIRIQNAEEIKEDGTLRILKK
jgi:hypothetical protein